MYRHFRMCLYESIIQKSNVSDNAKSIRKNGKLVSIAEMAINVLLFGIGRRCSLRRHETISHLKRVNVGIVFIIGL